ncbi:carbohydrate ABC transporter permease [Alicyclobacillus curvatus]|nr:carbohydrate ABC transporter permease [Alicyclobacillus curvatus]
MSRQLSRSHFITHAVLTVGAIIMVLPFLWMVLTSLKPDSELLSSNWIPHHFAFVNYWRAWTAAPFDTYYRNSILVTVFATAGQVLTSAMAGYAFSKIKFVGRHVIFFAILAALMIPLQAIIIPVYLILVGFHWTNTLTGLIVPMIPSAFGVFLFKQFFDDIPSDLEEAAFLDGAGRYRILFQIFLPLSKPVISAFGILSFLFNWNNFFYPLIVVTSTKVQTLPLGLSVFSNGNTTDYNLLMAATTLTIIPVLILFLFVQRYFIQGVAMSGIK